MITPYEKEKTMDRFYFYQQLAKEYQREISQDLANRHLLSDAEGKSPSVKRARPLVITLVRIASAITILLLFVSIV
jgi:hypothetical protein